jgi:hypothetical protein
LAGELEKAIRRKAAAVQLTAEDLEAKESSGVVEVEDEDEGRR